MRATTTFNDIIVTDITENWHVKVLMLKGEKGDIGDAGNYSTLANRPQINGVTLVGNKTSSNLGLASASDLTTVRNNVNTLQTTVNGVQTDVNGVQSGVVTNASAIGTLANLNTTAKTNLVSAINEVKSDKADGHNGVVSNITASSTGKLVDLGIVDSGVFVVFLFGYVQNTDTCSIYFLRTDGSTYYVTPIFEGTNGNAPRVSSSGVLTLNSSTIARQVYWSTLKLG